jgi:hypothetical protein
MWRTWRIGMRRNTGGERRRVAKLSGVQHHLSKCSLPIRRCTAVGTLNNPSCSLALTGEIRRGFISTHEKDLDTSRHRLAYC